MRKEYRFLFVLLLCSASLQAQWLYWGDGEYQNFQANPWAGVQLDLALRFEPADIAAYEGKSITKMKFHPGPVSNVANYQIKIWEADPGATPVLMYSQPVSTVVFGQWNEVDVTTPWIINSEKELWFGVSIDQGGTVGYDAGPAEPGKGNKFGNGAEWYDWGTGNWTIQAFVEDLTPVLYSLALLSEPEQGGVVTGGGTYQAGQIVPVEASANQGYVFQYWIDGQENIYDAAFDFIMPDNDVTLTALFEPVVQSEWLFWGDGEYNNFQANPWAGVQLDLALRFEPADISDFDGRSITKMKFHPGPVSNVANYQIKIWEADPGATPVLMYSQPVPAVVFGQWNEVDVTTPWTINSAKELWFGVSIDQGGTVGYDAGPAEPGKGNKFGNGAEWYDWGDGNWLVQALITGGGSPTYNLTLVSNPEEGGTVSGSGTYPVGENIDAVASANPDFEFINWTLNGEVISTEVNFTFTMPEENVTLTANFVSTIPQYTLVLSANPENAGILTGSGEYAEGEEVTVSATSNEGFSFVSWTQNGAVISTEESFVFVMPAENAGLVANFDMIYPDFYEAVIGEDQQFPQEVRMPFDFDWRNSVSQTLYYPDEMGISRGVINMLTYFKNFSQDVMNKEVKVWMGETNRQNLVSGWIPPSELNLVFEGSVDFPQGEGEINIQLDTPYEYNGGILVIYSNRVFEQQYFSWNERFFASKDTGRYRTRQFNEDVPIDPVNPSLSSNYVLDWHPNIKLSFPTTLLGGIEGVVTDGSQPLEGVKVTIEGTTAETYTNISGHYSIPFILADSYKIRFSKLGFMTHIESEFGIEAGGITPLDVVLDASAQVEVTGVVQGNDGVKIQDAEIMLSGNSDYSTTSDPGGQFLLTDVYEGLYTLSVTAENYTQYLVEEVLISGDNFNLGTIILTEKIIPPLGLTVNTDSQDPGSAMMNWYHGEPREYRYDNGTYTYWVGSAEGDINSVFGSAYRSDAVLTEVSWYLTSEVGTIYPEVKIWIFGLDNKGIPDTSNVLYTAENVPNINDEWNVHVLDQPVVAPNGFLVGVSYSGFYALGCDNGLDPEWPYTENTLYYVEYGETDFIPIESLVSGWALNFMIRAYGVNNQELEKYTARKPVLSMYGASSILTERADAKKIPMPPVFSNDEAAKNREFIGYNIFLNDMGNPLTTTTDKQHLLEHLPAGIYVAGVQTAYTSGVSEIVTKSFEISNGTPPQSVFIPEGWSGWSSYNIPGGDGSFADVVDPVAGEMMLTQYFNQLYYPQYGINTMGNFSNVHGYISKMESDVELSVTGLRAPKTIGLIQGWNLVPVISPCEVDAAGLFSQITELIIAFEVAGNGIYWPGVSNTLQTLSSGKAYWVKVSDSCTITFPDCIRQEKAAFIPPQRYTGESAWNSVAYTGVSHLVVFNEKAMKNFLPGDVIGAFTQDGICAGANVFSGGKVTLALFGDDLTTDIKDGFSDDEPINFRIYRPGRQQSYPAKVIYNDAAPDHLGLFKEFGVSVIDHFEFKTTGFTKQKTNILQIYPNPSSGVFNIVFDAPTGGAKYYIQNTSGITVEAGTFGSDRVIDLQNQPDGMYYLYIQGQVSAPKKLIKK